MESFVQALGKSKAECREFSTLRKFLQKFLVDGPGNIATLGSNVVTLKTYLSGTSRCWVPMSRCWKNISQEHRDVEPNVAMWNSKPF